MPKLASSMDSELTSIALSDPEPSPPRHPPLPPAAVYYIQSPSSRRNPTRSPPHSYNYAARHHSRDGSSTIPHSGSSQARRMSDDDETGAGLYSEHKTWIRDADVEEERLIDEFEEDRGGACRSCRCFVLSVLMFSLLVFSMVALALWNRSHNQSPIVKMKSIRFESFDVQAGTDASMVPTALGTLNSTVEFTYRNTGKSFGVHVTSTPVLLYYYQTVMARGNIDYFYQAERSEREMKMVVVGDKVPLYGGGYGLSSKKDNNVNVSLSLNFTMSSRAYVLGRMVEPKFYNSVQCLLTMDSANLQETISLKDSCKYN